MPSLNQLQEWALRRGWRLAGGDPGLLEVLRRDLAMDIDAGRFGQGLQRRVLSRFRYLDGVNLTPIKSLL
ncbi:MAG: hypothetical protein Q8P31_05990, partial [Bacillota bacterium]|nr:hypothetical protein [Bacillota bacterium]